MKFMVSWKIPPGSYRAAGAKFLGSAPEPLEDLTILGRWHAPGCVRGWTLVESDDLTPVSHHVAEWADKLEIEVTPVSEDAEAVAGISPAFGA